MLHVPKLDDISYDKMVEKVRSQIPLYIKDWTDFNDHDPGITILQTFAWLIDNLNYYINATGEVHRLKYLKLLGIVPHQAPASCDIALSTHMASFVLPKGAQLEANGRIFELAQSYREKKNRVLHVFSEINGEFSEITGQCRGHGEYAAVFSHSRDDDSALYIGFEQIHSGEFSFHIEIAAQENRNSFERGFELSKIIWEAFVDEKWQQIAVKGDQTGGLLVAGKITLELPENIEQSDGISELPSAFYIRARLAENNLDCQPMIGRITPNTVQVVQTNTKVQKLEYVYNGENKIEIDHYVGSDDTVNIAVEQQDGCIMWYSNMDESAHLCDVVSGEYSWQRYVVFDEKEFGSVPAEGSKIYVFIISGDIAEKMVLGTTNGCASQRMEVPAANICQLSVAVVEQIDGRAHYSLWQRCDDVSTASYDEAVFSYDEAVSEIVFGDSINGMVPKTGCRVVLVHLSCSDFELGNVRPKSINSFVDSAFDDVQVYNFKDAVGGISHQSTHELEKELESKINQSTRAVSRGDFEIIIKNTPGLMIERVNLMSGKNYTYLYGEALPPNTIVAVVKPYSFIQKHPALSEVYCNHIKTNLESYRLLTTNIEIHQPRYLAIEINGRIELEVNSVLCRNTVRDKLHELIDYMPDPQFGKDIVYGRIYSLLEMMDCVKRIDQLTFSCLGQGGEKNEQDDILVYPDALPYIYNIDIEFI